MAPAVYILEILFENVEIRKTFIHFCIVKPVGILVVNSVHIGGLEDYVGVDLGGAKGGAGIGREEGASGSASENYNSPLFKVTYGAASDVRLGNLLHGNGGLNSRLASRLLDAVGKGNGSL